MHTGPLSHRYPFPTASRNARSQRVSRCSKRASSDPASGTRSKPSALHVAQHASTRPPTKLHLQARPLGAPRCHHCIPRLPSPSAAASLSAGANPRLVRIVPDTGPSARFRHVRRPCTPHGRVLVLALLYGPSEAPLLGPPFPPTPPPLAFIGYDASRPGFVRPSGLRQCVVRGGPESGHTPLYFDVYRTYLGEPTGGKGGNRFAKSVPPFGQARVYFHGRRPFFFKVSGFFFSFVFMWDG
ncbi:hypothetical protein C8Q79DRAFT_218045 [Trametes meyenii]|nr:hypothetical protein C8Q79DRAFT_218045 [Trametes meyenii]